MAKSNAKKNATVVKATKGGARPGTKSAGAGKAQALAKAGGGKVSAKPAAGKAVAGKADGGKALAAKSAAKPVKGGSAAVKVGGKAPAAPVVAKAANGVKAAGEKAGGAKTAAVVVGKSNGAGGKGAPAAGVRPAEKVKPAVAAAGVAKAGAGKTNGHGAGQVAGKNGSAKEGTSGMKPGRESLPPRRPERVMPPEPAYTPPLPTQVFSDEKPKKNQAGLGAKELENFRELLLEKRRELVGDMSSMEREALRSGGGSNLSNLPVHMADMGTDNYEQEFTLGLVEKDRQLLREINSALAKIQSGTYGICEGTGKPISKPRLEAQPWAKYSIDFARELEKGRLR